MSRKQSVCVDHLRHNLEELKRRSDLESLRPYLVSEQCFPPGMEAITEHAINMEDLKKLARAWKLHGETQKAKSISILVHRIVTSVDEQSVVTSGN